MKFSLDEKKLNIFDFNRIEFVDTELLKKQLDKKHPWNIRKMRADIIVRIGLKGIKKDAFVCIILEHKSMKEHPFKIFSQTVDYNMALIGAGECPALTIVFYHGQTALNFPSDLKSYSGWTSEMREILGDSGLNCVLDVLDLNHKSEKELDEKGGILLPFYLSLRSFWSLTWDQVRFILELSNRYLKYPGVDIDFRKVLSVYLLKGLKMTGEPLKSLNEIKAQLMSNKEDRTMASVFDSLINTGVEKGRQEGLQTGRQEEKQNVILEMLKDQMSVQAIMKYTGAPRELILELQKQVSL